MLTTDPEMVVKSLARGNFELIWHIFTEISAFDSLIWPLHRCVLLYDVFKAIHVMPISHLLHRLKLFCDMSSYNYHTNKHLIDLYHTICRDV